MFKYVFLVCIAISTRAFGADQFKWPEQYKAAVSLGYDDALISQLNNAIPELNRLGIKASFYLSLNSPTLVSHLSQWRLAAQQGHELGNHSLFHQCRASKPDREWVSADNDLDKLPAKSYVQQIRVASNYLNAIDNNTRRTFTAPCADVKAAGEFYLDQIKTLFVGIKSKVVQQPIDNMLVENPYAVSFIAPYDVTGEALVALVKQAANKGTMIHFTFHGIGGDYLSISNQAHNTLLRYLSEHKQTLWTDTFINIVTYMKKEQRRLGIDYDTQPVANSFK
ncbi:polysaccharide deacetylase family protein [Planctobacterium marinum]|uniref:polysaccharide deacetylase family protein n=1 Tax=Planctobacterium marinum TaxID=1631968 RepID=UPI001E5FC6F6|nr:polysaccharide deacetylase family protein [Planctobacterium marinum]MCC2606400.1 polysaccharide deacetylase family protein [Planctobacterium marinum]